VLYCGYYWNWEDLLLLSLALFSTLFLLTLVLFSELFLLALALFSSLLYMPWLYCLTCSFFSLALCCTLFLLTSAKFATMFLISLAFVLYVNIVNMEISMVPSSPNPKVIPITGISFNKLACKIRWDIDY
jgi:hypothetical protein